MREKKRVVIGLLGSNLDKGEGQQRWERWRPSVAICQQDDLVIHRFELLHDRHYSRLAEQIAVDIESVSPETEVRKMELTIKDPWDFEEVYESLHEFARSYSFAPDREDYLVHITTGTHVAQICLFLLTESRHLPARLIQASPPKRGQLSGPGSYAIIDLDLSKYDRIASRFQKEQREALSFLKSGIDTRNPGFNQLIEQIEHVAVHSKDPILLIGPTGAGKSHLARRIYELKKFRHQITGPFVEVNCATLRGDAAMSTLFGHTRGAFTGAVKDRPGLLRTAHGGLLFLDEIGELGCDEQAMLLRAIEEKRFLPVGADAEVDSNFQIIAGTNRDLAASMAQGSFREDLLARINLWTFRLPGLRDRVEDIEPNLQYELERYAERNGTRVTFSKEVRDCFLQFARSPTALWNANFRDLNAAVTRMATLAPGGRVTMEVLQQEIRRLVEAWKGPDTKEESAQLGSLFSPEKLAAIDLFDQVQLAYVMQVCRDAATMSEAGRTLFSASRQKRKNQNDADRLSKYLARFNLTWEDCKKF